jgi:WD40 repeat protein
MVSFSPDGHSLVTAHEDGNVRLWNADTGAPGLSFGKQQKPVSSATFSIDGSRVVAASEDGSVHMWEAASGTKIGVFGDKGADESKALFAELAPDGRFVVVATENKGLQVWSVETGKKVATLGVSSSGNSYYHLAFSPDGRRLVAGGSGNVTIWDWASWVEMTRLDYGSGGLDPPIIWSVAFSPDGNRVAAGNSLGTAVVVDISMMMKGDAFAVACQYLRSDTNLADAAERYGLGELQPICGDQPPLPANAAAIR